MPRDRNGRSSRFYAGQHAGGCNAPSEHAESRVSLSGRKQFIELIRRRVSSNAIARLPPSPAAGLIPDYLLMLFPPVRSTADDDAGWRHLKSTDDALISLSPYRGRGSQARSPPPGRVSKARSIRSLRSIPIATAAATHEGHASSKRAPLTPARTNAPTSAQCADCGIAPGSKLCRATKR